MALVVDEIVDIVEDRLDIEVASDSPGVLGSAVVKGQATEIIDVGHFLPLAFDDWFRRKDNPCPSAPASRCCWSTIPPFFRNMLAPVLQAAGFDVTSVGSGSEALAHIADEPHRSMSSSPISKCPRWTDSNSRKRCAGIRATADIPIIALSSIVSPEADRARPRSRIPRFRRKIRPARSDRGAQRADGIWTSGMTERNDSEYVTAVVGGELFGLPILPVQDVFVPEGSLAFRSRLPRSRACSTCAAAS